MPSRVIGIRCAVCGTNVALDTPLVSQCPYAHADDSRHILSFLTQKSEKNTVVDADNPFIRFREQLAVDAFGEAIGIGISQRCELIEELDASIRATDGVGFRITPLERADQLSEALHFSSEGGIWVKDETHNVAGSHKARHLFTELLYLLMSEKTGRVPWSWPHDRPALAIASCGNAAIAAATLARAVNWPIAVHVPVAAQDSVISTLSSLDADIRVCARQKNDAPGDPCVLRFRELVAGGALPFGVQGTENVWCLDGGRTLGWEMKQQMPDVDRVFVQVGGGAFAASLANSYFDNNSSAHLHAVQTEGCAPLIRAWDVWAGKNFPNDLAQNWSTYMWPWESEPASFADGILDDETYDWIDVLGGMRRTGGSGIQASEENVVQAHALAHKFTSIDVSPTGSAGLAGLLQIRHEIADDERVLVVFSGHSR